MLLKQYFYEKYLMITLIGIDSQAIAWLLN